MASLTLSFFFYPMSVAPPALHSFPTRRSSDLTIQGKVVDESKQPLAGATVSIKGSEMRVSTDESGNFSINIPTDEAILVISFLRSEEHTSELQSRENLVCRLRLEKKKSKNKYC